MSKKILKAENKQPKHKDGSMIIRYIIFWFLGILAIIQLLLPEYFIGKKEKQADQEKILAYYHTTMTTLSLDEQRLLQSTVPSPLLVSRDEYYEIILFPLINENKKQYTAVLFSILKEMNKS